MLCVSNVVSDEFKQKTWSSASSLLSGILLSVLINLKGPFPLLQEQQLIKWLISDGRVWMFWVNFIDLWAGQRAKQKLTSPWAPGRRFTPLSFKDTSKPKWLQAQTLLCCPGKDIVWASLAHAQTNSENTSEKDILSLTCLTTALLQGL